MNIFAFLPDMPVWFQRVVQGACVVTTLALGALYHFQEKLLYIPVIPGVTADYVYNPEEDFQLSYEEVQLRAADGTRLHCWHIHGPKAGETAPAVKKPVLLFFQENAGNMSWRLPFLAAVVRYLKCSIFVLGYRGYGQSEGSPNQKGLEMDCEAAFEHVLSRPDVDTERVVLYGKSLGGAVTLHLAAKHKGKIRASIIENTFISVEHMVPRVLPALGLLIGPQRPLNFLVRNKWQNFKRIQEVGDMPMLLIGSVKDEMVPFEHMVQLNKLKSTTRSTFLACERSSHMNAYEADRATYWPALREFWAQYVAE